MGKLILRPSQCAKHWSLPLVTGPYKYVSELLVSPDTPAAISSILLLLGLELQGVPLGACCWLPLALLLA